MAGHVAARRAAIAAVLVVLVALAWWRLGPAKSSAPWQAAVDLSVRGDAAHAPQVAVDGRGNAVAVWYANTRGGLLVQSATRSAGGTWRGPVDLSPASRNAAAPQVAVGARGTAVAVWKSDRIAYVGPRVVLSAVRELGEGWQAPVRLSAAGGAADAPQVAVDPNGDAVAVWTKHRGSGRTRVQSSTRRRGDRWQAPVDIGEISAASHAGAANPRVAVDARGNAAALWTDVAEDGGVVQSAVRRAGRGWEPPIDMSRPDHRSSGTRIAFDARGNAVAVWADATDLRVRSRTRPPEGKWGAPVDIFDRNVDGAGVAVSAGGNEMLAWTKEGASIAVAGFTAAGRWRPRDDVSIDEETRDITIAIDDRGNAAAVWLRGEGGDMVRAALLPAGDGWQSALDVSPHAVTSEASGAQVDAVVDSTGSVVAVWGREMQRRGEVVNVVQAASHVPP